MLIAPRSAAVAGRAIRRVTPIGRTAATVALGGLPLVAAAAWDVHDLAPMLTIAAIIGGSAAGWLVDDVPGEITTPVVIGAPARRALRAAYVIGVLVAALWLLAGVVSRVADTPVVMRPLIPLVAATASVAVAVATVAFRSGERAPATWGVPGAVVAVTLIGGLAFRWPGWLPTLVAGPSFSHWWYITMAALVVVVVAGADPGRRMC